MFGTRAGAHRSLQSNPCQRVSAPQETPTQPDIREIFVSMSERKRELKRRRHRRKKLVRIVRKMEKASVSEKVVTANKIRSMTPGAEVIISRLGLEERK